MFSRVEPGEHFLSAREDEIAVDFYNRVCYNVYIGTFFGGVGCRLRRRIMKNITEQLIQALAPNPAAAANGKKLSKSGAFANHARSADDTFFMAECKGSGKNPYVTSADYIDPEKPVFRCSCPSRQFPCKHSLGLLYEMMSDKTFETCEIPEDIVRKRSKIAAKNAPEKSPEELTPEEAAKLEKKKAAAAKTAKKAKSAKLQKQLEGLDLCEKAVKELVSAGLGTMGGASLSTYQNLSKQLGDYYLIGPQRLLNKLIFEISAYQADSKETHFDNAIDVLEKLYALIKKSRVYINNKLESGDVSADDDILYEELGGAWKISELEALGKCEKNARLAQLSFWVTFDEGRREYIDTGVWLDLNTSKVFLTKNYRPLKSLKYVKADDTVFGAVNVPSMAVYPGEGNVRVRWDGAEFSELCGDDFAKIRAAASKSINADSKEIKNLLKNAMQSPLLFKLVEFSKIGKVGEAVILKQSSGDTLTLLDNPELEPTVERLSVLPNAGLLEHGVMLCAFFYDAQSRFVCAQPLAIIPNNENSVIRLLY